MSPIPRALLALLGLTPVVAASGGLAHARLLLASPPAHGVVDGRGDIALHFSETLVAPFSGIKLASAGRPARIMPTILSPDRKTLIARLKAPLPAGAYTLSWHAVSTDTHRVEGAYGFTVK